VGYCIPTSSRSWNSRESITWFAAPKLLVDASPVWLVHDNPERSVNYVSFTAYMQTAAEWYESGAAEAHDLHQLRAIHQRHNPGAQFPYAVE